MKNKTILLFLILGFICSNPVFSQDTIDIKPLDGLFKLSLDDFMEIVITPSKLPQSESNVTQKIDVIDANEIQTIVSGNRNICEIISKLPGASVSVLSRNDANWGTYGGIGPKYSTYMLQGLPVDAFMDPMSLDVNIISQVEVQRGQASVIYPNYLSQDFSGNQSPLAGTVNLILKTKIEEQKTIFQTSYGSYNTLNGQFYHQDRVDKLNYFMGTTYEMSDYINYGSKGSWLNMKKNPEYKKTKLYGGITLFMDSREKQKFTAFFQKTLHTGDAGRVYRGFDNQYGILNIGYDLRFNDKLHLQSHFGMRSYDRTWQESKFGNTDTLMSDNGVKQSIIPADISLSWIMCKTNSISIGADYQAATYETWADPLLGYQLYGNKASSRQYGLYLQDEWRPLTKILIRGGIRYSSTKNKVALVNNSPGHNDKDSWNKVLWSAGARYSVNKNFAIYANAGTSFAVQGFKSESGTILLGDYGVPGHNGQLPNPDLKPETGVAADAGIELKLPANIKVGLRVFNIILQDAIIDIVVCQNPSQSQSLNAETDSRGGEIEVSQRINSSFSWFINATYMITNIKNDSNQVQNDVEIPFAPNNVINAGLSYSTPFGLEFAPYLNYNGGFYDGTSKNDRKWFTPGIVLNTYISQRIAKGYQYKVDCFAQLYNVTNNDYMLPWQFMNTGFSGMYGIRVTFN